MSHEAGNGCLRRAPAPRAPACEPFALSGTMPPRESGGIGRRPGFRYQCRKAWGFESPLSHHQRTQEVGSGARRGWPRYAPDTSTPADDTMRSGNPALKASTFLDSGTGVVTTTGDGAMTLNGTVNRTAFLLVLTLVGAMYTWNLFFASGGAANLATLRAGRRAGRLWRGDGDDLQEDLGAGHGAAVCRCSKACSSARSRRSSNSASRAS